MLLLEPYFYSTSLFGRYGPRWSSAPTASCVLALACYNSNFWGLLKPDYATADFHNEA